MVNSSHQLTGVAAIESALKQGQALQLILIQKDTSDPAVLRLRERAEKEGLPLRLASANDLRRMSRVSPPAPALALVGRNPNADAEDVLAEPGLLWLLAGVQYPSNVGFILRTVEVTGAQGVFVDAPFSRRDRIRSLRISIRADRFLPIFWQNSAQVIEAARRHARPIYAVETTGAVAPWEVDLSGRPLLIVGGERDGIPTEILTACDATIRIPTPGFIPSLNVQASVSAIACERLRQLAESSA